MQSQARTATTNPLKMIGHVARTFTRLGDARLRDLGLAMGQLPVLVSLKDGVSRAQGELAQIAQVEQPSMAQLLARMERDGLVQRTPDPADGRSRLVSLTPMARRKLPQGKALLDAQVDEVLADFTPLEVELLSSMLLRIGVNLERMGAEAGGGR